MRSETMPNIRCSSRRSTGEATDSASSFLVTRDRQRVASRSRRALGPAPPSSDATPFSTTSSTHARLGLKAGVGRLSCSPGEAGIGKTTLLDAFRERVAARGPIRITSGQCVQHYGASESYQPLLEALGRLCRQPGAEDVIARCSSSTAPRGWRSCPCFLQPERLERLQRIVAGITRDRMLRELSDALESITTRVPLVLCLEDA